MVKTALIFGFGVYTDEQNTQSVYPRLKGSVSDGLQIYGPQKSIFDPVVEIQTNAVIDGARPIGEQIRDNRESLVSCPGNDYSSMPLPDSHAIPSKGMKVLGKAQNGVLASHGSAVRYSDFARFIVNGLIQSGIIMGINFISRSK
jgi:hypothetical protein